MKIAFPHPPGSGGPGSFQMRFEKELRNRGCEITYADEKGSTPDFIFVVGGTRRLFWLMKMKWKRVPVLYRLDGISWLHKKKKVGWKYYLLAEFRNWASKFIHAFIADKVIYQSQFVNDWWDRSGWRKRKNTAIIYNGVKIPQDIESPGAHHGKNRLVILEGTIDYSPYAVQLINELAENLREDIDIDVYGKFENPLNEKKIHNRINYYGFLEREEVMKVLSGSVYLSLDINPACPNTVIEAMANGAPVVAFDTGALPELVDNGAGILVPYGSDPWKLGYPDVNLLSNDIEVCFSNYHNYSRTAIQAHNDKFTLKIMMENYVGVLQKMMN